MIPGNGKAHDIVQFLLSHFSCPQDIRVEIWQENSLYPKRVLCSRGETVRNQILKSARPGMIRSVETGEHMSKTERSRIRKVIQRLLSLFGRNIRREPESPADPYAYVTAPKKPRPSGRSAAAVAELPEE
jgi:hypothetical protein